MVMVRLATVLMTTAMTMATSVSATPTSATAATAATTPSVKPTISLREAGQLAQVDSTDSLALLARMLDQEKACRQSSNDEVVVTRCQVAGLLGERFAADPIARQTALELYERTGTVVGVLPEQDMDGAYRGRLHLVPMWPVGAEGRRHLRFATDALLDFDDFFARLGGPVSYRWRPLGLRFFESVKRRTPSAFAVGWTVSYNLRGSLFRNATAVRETFFHEVFHLNDQARGNWSIAALGDIYRRIVARCGMKKDCLTPYAPDSIVVRGGTYYAFMPDNGVTEYAADIAKRYYVEQRSVLHGRTVPRPFKCQRRENADAWLAVVDEFFGGIDHVPACAKAPP